MATDHLTTNTVETALDLVSEYATRAEGHKAQANKSIIMACAAAAIAIKADPTITQRQAVGQPSPLRRRLTDAGVPKSTTSLIRKIAPKLAQEADRWQVTTEATPEAVGRVLEALAADGITGTLRLTKRFGNRGAWGPRDPLAALRRVLDQMPTQLHRSAKETMDAAAVRWGVVGL